MKTGLRRRIARRHALFDGVLRRHDGRCTRRSHRNAQVPQPHAHCMVGVRVCRDVPLSGDASTDESRPAGEWPVTTNGGQSSLLNGFTVRKRGGSRTRDRRIVSPLLYPLSYTLCEAWTSFVRTRTRNAPSKPLTCVPMRAAGPDGHHRHSQSFAVSATTNEENNKPLRPEAEGAHDSLDSDESKLSRYLRRGVQTGRHGRHKGAVRRRSGAIGFCSSLTGGA